MARISPRLWSPAAVLALAAASSAFADPARDAVSIQAMPGGVADAPGATGFVTNANRNVVAVNLTTGRETWAGARGDYPVAVIGDRVLVLNAESDKLNVLRLSAFDMGTGKMGLQSDPIVFPEWVNLRPGDDQTFGMFPRFDGGDLWLRWRARAAKKSATGAVHIDLKSGKVDMLDAGKMPPPPPPALPLSAALTKLAQRDYETPAGPETNVLTAGSYAAAVDVEKDGATQKVILRRWDATTEKEQDPVTLAQGGCFQVILSPVAGMVSIRPAPGPKRPAGAWRIYSLETGKLRASFPAESGTLDAAVVGGRFYYTYTGPPPRDLDPAEATAATRVAMLKAVDLTTARLAWWKPLDPDNPFWSFLYVNTPPGATDDP